MSMDMLMRMVWSLEHLLVYVVRTRVCRMDIDMSMDMKMSLVM